MTRHPVRNESDGGVELLMISQLPGQDDCELVRLERRLESVTE